MSLLRWLLRKPDADDPASTGSLPDSTRPSPLAMSRREERNARRERLYAVVRESMVHAGVLSASYRFKVLSLDGRGRQFLVMVDLVGSPGGGMADLGRIEASIIQTARAQHDIAVKAVYWRESPVAGGARVKPTEAPAPQARPAAAADEPLLAEEVAAFKRALAAGERPSVRSFDGAKVQGPQSYTLLTGFEDTETAPPELRASGLSNSQHGDLR